MYGSGPHLSSSSSPQGYQSSYPNQSSSTGPPHNVDPQLWHWFNAVNTGRSGSISSAELQAALVNGDRSRFDLDTVKMLMTMFDPHRNGTIGFQEFSGLWNYFKDWQAVFAFFDKDRSGTINGQGLAAAFRSFGYRLTPSLLTLIQQKYASGPTTGNNPPPGITFDRFIRACVVVRTLTEAFQRLDTDRDGLVSINYEEFMRIVLYAP